MRANLRARRLGCYDGAIAKLHVNGQLVGRKAMDPPKNWNQELFPGTNSTTDRSSAGLYDEVRFFRGAIPEATLQAIYNEELPLVTEP